MNSVTSFWSRLARFGAWLSLTILATAGFAEFVRRLAGAGDEEAEGEPRRSARLRRLSRQARRRRSWSRTQPARGPRQAPSSSDKATEAVLEQLPLRLESDAERAARLLQLPLQAVPEEAARELAAVSSARTEERAPKRTAKASARKSGVFSKVRRTRSFSGFAAAQTTVLVALPLILFASVSIAPVSSLWSKNLTISGELELKPKKVHGCSPGYWKTHKWVWDGKDEDYTEQVQWYDKFNDWFDVTPEQSGFSNFRSLYGVLWSSGFGDGGLRALGRHAVAALANADAHENGFLPNYPFTVNDVYQIYRSAVVFHTRTIEEAKDIFEATERFCPLGKGPGGHHLRTSGAAEFDVEGGDAGEDPPIDTRGLSDFEIKAGLGDLPDIPEACAGMTFDTVFVMQEPGEDETFGTRDLIFGSDGDDVIRSGDGDDCVVGGGGNDRVDAGGGNDRVLGGEGDDRVQGMAGADRLFGEAGNDRIWGGDGNDAIDGGPGDDRCAGQGGTNTVTACELAPGPTGLSGTFHHSTPTVSLQWTPVPGAKYYNIYASGEPGGGPDSTYIPLDSSGKASYDHVDVDENAVYYYVVTAVDGDGFESAPSRELRVVTQSTSPTATPQPTQAPKTPTPTPRPDSTATPTPASSPTATPAASATPTATKPPTATPSPTPQP